LGDGAEKEIIKNMKSLCNLVLISLIIISCNKQDSENTPATKPPNGALKSLIYRYFVGIDTLTYYYTGNKIDSFYSNVFGDFYKLQYNEAGEIAVRVRDVHDASNSVVQYIDSFYYQDSRVYKMVTAQVARNTGLFRKLNAYELAFNGNEISKYYQTDFAPDGFPYQIQAVQQIQYTNGNLTKLILNTQGISYGADYFDVTYSDQKLPPYLKKNLLQLAPWMAFHWLSSNTRFAEYLFFINSENIPLTIRGSSSMDFMLLEHPNCPDQVNLKFADANYFFLKADIEGCQ